MSEPSKEAEAPEPAAAPKSGETAPAAAAPAAPGTGEAKPRFAARCWQVLRAVAVPTVAAIWAALGTFWTIFAWYHHEVVVPSTAPVNLVTEVTVQQVSRDRPGVSKGGEPLDAIQVSVSANNVSTKTIHMLSNYWDAWGGTVTQTAPDSEESWLARVNAAQADQDRTGQPDYAIPGKHYKPSRLERVAWGNLFPTSYVLHPKETISASVIFYVPAGSYDMIHVEVHIPTTERADLSLMFVVDKQNVHPVFFGQDAEGKKIEIRDKAGIAAASAKIQETQALREIALLGGGAASRDRGH